MKTLIAIIIGLSFTQLAFAASMTTFTRPGFDQVNAMGFDGVNVVGFHESNQGFIYNTITQTWKDFIPPEVTNSRPWGVDGDITVGIFNNNNSAFHYDRTTMNFTDMTIPGLATQPRDVSGNIIVGSVGSSLLIYDIWTSNPSDSNSYQALKHPSNQTTRAWGIEGNIIVGEYGTNGFIYDMNLDSWQTLNRSGASRTNIQGISGNLLSGFYTNESGHTIGFVYNMNSDEWTDIPNPDPLSTFMQARSVEGNVVVGSYRPTIGAGDIGFIYTIPEPSVTAMSFILILALASRRKR